MKETKNKKSWFEYTQKQIDKKYQETIDYGRTQFVNKIVELEEQLEMVKSLYQNEKDHTDTLKRIIKKIEEILQKEYKENVFGHYEYDLATAKNTIKKILNLLKEIK